jgi:hypothetical protein
MSTICAKCGVDVGHESLITESGECMNCDRAEVVVVMPWHWDVVCISREIYPLEQGVYVEPQTGNRTCRIIIRGSRSKVAKAKATYDDLIRGLR